MGTLLIRRNIIIMGMVAVRLLEVVLPWGEGHLWTFDEAIACAVVACNPEGGSCWSISKMVLVSGLGMEVKVEIIGCIIPHMYTG